MNTLKSSTVKNNLPCEPIRLSKRIGSIIYEVEVRFNPDANETMNDKKLRLVKRDMEAAS